MKIKCSGIKYRQGFVEVGSGVHDGFVNLEVWTVQPDSSNFESASELAEVPEHEISSNSEIELDVEQAKSMVAEIQKAIFCY
ncbi:MULTISPECIES: hypothetical protein [unclassified Microbulbifer]|uniref:hypothetical protein n=1 Tax=unclassified Microbulbifer TaxID=2619833 RepID=UPI0027E4BD2D|nr:MULTISPECIES: hypothetical protein [unclassified Microbulbifer]